MPGTKSKYSVLADVKQATCLAKCLDCPGLVLTHEFSNKRFEMKNCLLPLLLAPTSQTVVGFGMHNY